MLEKAFEVSVEPATLFPNRITIRLTGFIVVVNFLQVENGLLGPVDGIIFDCMPTKLTDRIGLTTVLVSGPVRSISAKVGTMGCLVNISFTDPFVINLGV